MFWIESSGSTKNAEAFLQKMMNFDVRSILEVYAQQGVDALESATPTDTGLAANSWGYEITGGRNGYTIAWTNSDVESGFPVAIMIQMGHGTGTGGYVQGRDYINPAIRPIFDKIAEEVVKAVTSA